MWWRTSPVAILARLMALLRPLLLIVLGTASCVLPSEPRSRVRVDRTWGFAGGADEQEATELAEIVDEVLPSLRKLDAFQERSLRIHFSDNTGPELTEGITVAPLVGKPWIGVKRGKDNIGNTVAHELVHFYFERLLTRFPSVLQEGMAEHLAAEIFPEPKRRERLLVFVAASYLDSFNIEVRGAGARASLPYLVQPVPSVEEVFRVDWYGNLKGDARARETLYGLGLLIAERIGWSGLLELARRADEEGLDRVPGEWVRIAAGIEPPNQENMSEALFAAFGSVRESDRGTFRIIVNE